MQVQEVISEDLLTCPHRPEDRGNMETGGRNNTNVPKPPFTQDIALGTQPASQSVPLPNTCADTAAPDPFLGGRTQGLLLPEDGLAGCLLADATNSFNNLSRLSMFWKVAHRWPEASRFAFNCYHHFP